MNYRICTKCEEKFPATDEFFHKQKAGRFGLCSICKVCVKEHGQKYRKNNKEKRTAAVKKWSDNNPEKRTAAVRKYYKNNKEKVATTMKKWRKNNKEKRAKYQKEWRQDNPDKYNSYAAKRRARKLNQSPVLTEAEQLRMNLYHTICTYLNKTCDTPKWNVDHIQPLSKGGLNHPDNLQILTAKLNMEKHNKWPLTSEEKIKYKGIKI